MVEVERVARKTHGRHIGGAVEPEQIAAAEQPIDGRFRHRRPLRETYSPHGRVGGEHVLVPSRRSTSAMASPNRRRLLEVPDSDAPHYTVNPISATKRDGVRGYPADVRE